MSHYSDFYDEFESKRSAPLTPVKPIKFCPSDAENDKPSFSFTPLKPVKFSPSEFN